MFPNVCGASLGEQGETVLWGTVSQYGHRPAPKSSPGHRGGQEAEVGATLGQEMRDMACGAFKEKGDGQRTWLKSWRQESGLGGGEESGWAWPCGRHNSFEQVSGFGAEKASAGTGCRAGRRQDTWGREALPVSGGVK